MEKKHLNSPALPKPRGYSHVVAVNDWGPMIFVSGQVATDAQGTIVGPGDLKIQLRQVIANLKAALETAGATLADIIKTTTYIVDYKESDATALREARAELFPTGEPPASTLLGVCALAVEGLMVEMEAIAIVQVP